jgi:hypothetical protein
MTDTADADRTLAALRRRGDETVDRLLRENERHWQSMSAADRRTAETLARTIASRLLDRPARRLAAEPAVDEREAYAHILRVLFAVDAGDRAELARRSG